MKVPPYYKSGVYPPFARRAIVLARPHLLRALGENKKPDISRVAQLKYTSYFVLDIKQMLHIFLKFRL